MEINNLIIAIIVFIVVILIVVLVKRNQKDRKNFEDGLNQSEVKPEEHKSDEV